MGLPELVDQDIRELEIAVDKSTFVSVVYRFGDDDHLAHDRF